MCINTENPFHLNKLKSLVALFMNFETFLKQQQNTQKKKYINSTSSFTYNILYNINIISIYRKPSKPQGSQQCNHINNQTLVCGEN